jgi:hypothetical protein
MSSHLATTEQCRLAGGPVWDDANEAKPESTQSSLSPGFESSGTEQVGRERSRGFGGQELVSRPGSNGEPGQVSREDALPVVGGCEVPKASGTVS